MRRETAYKLAGRHHDRPLPGADIHKHREIRFKPLPPGQVERAWKLVYARAPQADETQAALDFLKQHDQITGNRQTSMIDLCHMLLNSNEFLHMN